MAESLRQKQSRFARMAAQLILQANDMGYEVTLGEAWRTPEQAAINAAKGIGIKRSLHIDRLAIDLNLYRDGVWLTKTPDFRELGEWWEAQGGAWGGRFNDGGHFSLAHEGRK